LLLDTSYPHPNPSPNPPASYETDCCDHDPRACLQSLLDQLTDDQATGLKNFLESML